MKEIRGTGDSWWESRTQINSELLHVVIVLARCQSSRQAFGIRFEEKTSNQWVADWAFLIKEKSAKSQGYADNVISGALGFDPAYPGCPGCKAPGIFVCVCGKVGCWDGVSRQLRCPWCGSAVAMGGSIQSLRVTGDV